MAIRAPGGANKLRTWTLSGGQNYLLAVLSGLGLPVRVVRWISELKDVLSPQLSLQMSSALKTIINVRSQVIYHDITGLLLYLFAIYEVVELYFEGLFSGLSAIMVKFKWGWAFFYLIISLNLAQNSSKIRPPP